MLTRSEGYFKGYQDQKLYYQAWTPKNPKGSLIITHGQGEHSECYSRLAEALKDSELTIYAWDLRGHGRSDGVRGYAKEFQDYVRDYEAFLRKLTIDNKITEKPIFLLAHSLGGLVQFKTLIDFPTLPVTAQILSGPLFGVSVPVPDYKKKAAQFFNKVYPKITLWNEIRYEHLTRDLAVIKEFQKDVLRHDRISPGVYIGFMEAIEICKHRASKIILPTLMQIAEKDPVISSADAIEVFNSISSSKKELKIYSGFKHEIYNDLEREIVYDDLRRFIVDCL